LLMACVSLVLAVVLLEAANACSGALSILLTCHVKGAHEPIFVSLKQKKGPPDGSRAGL